jgi:hypothetical protein
LHVTTMLRAAASANRNIATLKGNIATVGPSRHRQFATRSTGA